MPDVLELLRSTVPGDPPLLDHELLATRAHRRRTRRRTLVTSSALLLVAVAAVALTTAPSGQPAEVLAGDPTTIGQAEDRAPEADTSTSQLGEGFGTWTEASDAPLDPELFNISSGTLADGRVIVFGTRYLDDHSGAVAYGGAVYDPAGDTWAPIPALLPEVDFTSLSVEVVLADESMLVVGATTAGPLAAVYEVASGSWTVLPDHEIHASPTYWDGHTAVLVETDPFYDERMEDLASGQPEPTLPGPMVLHWSRGDDGWVESAESPLTPRYGAGSTVVDGRVHIVGGAEPIVGPDQDVQPLADGAVYDIATDTWAPLPDLPEPSTTVLGAIDGRVAAIAEVGGGFATLTLGSDGWHAGPMLPRANPLDTWSDFLAGVPVVGDLLYQPAEGPDQSLFLDVGDGWEPFPGRQLESWRGGLLSFTTSPGENAGFGPAEPWPSGIWARSASGNWVASAPPPFGDDPMVVVARSGDQLVVIGPSAGEPTSPVWVLELDG